MNIDALKAELAKPEYAEMTDQEAADALSALTVASPTVDVFGSFRTLAAILTASEYEVLRNTLDTQVAGSRLLADMVTMLSLPGDSSGNGGGIALNNPTTVAMLEQFATAEGLEGVPAKVAAYCATYQPSPQPLFGRVREGEVQQARAS